MIRLRSSQTRLASFTAPALILAAVAGLLAARPTFAANCPPIEFNPTPVSTITHGTPHMLGIYTTAVADFNRDGNPDLLHCGNPSAVVFQGDGRGGFGSGTNVPVGFLPTSVAVADLNGDNAPDLVFGTSAANSVRVVLGRGDGTFQASTGYPANASGTGSAQWVTTADFDGDLVRDIAVVGPTVGLSVLLGLGNGTFGAARNLPLTISQVWSGIAAGDFNGDSFPDVVCVISNNIVATLLNRGNGTFLAPTNSSLPGIAYLGGPRAADLDGDGVLDLVGLNSTKESVILRGQGNGLFAVVQEVPITATTIYAHSIADINGDGRLDVAVASATTIAILEGLGDGRVADPVYIPVASAVNMAVADLDKDARPDLAVWAGGTATTVRIYQNGTEFLPPVPVLSWARAGAVNRLVWYTNYFGYILEYSPSLDSGVQWAPATGSPLTIDCQNFYTLRTNNPGFYRLQKTP